MSMINIDPKPVIRIADVQPGTEVQTLNFLKISYLGDKQDYFVTMETSAGPFGFRLEDVQIDEHTLSQVSIFSMSLFTITSDIRL